MKKLLLTFILGLFASQSYAWTQLAVCTTPGDGLDDVTLYTDGEHLILHISSLEDSVPATEFRTNAGGIEQSLNILKEMKDLNRGVQKTYVLTSEDSIEFGGALTDSVLMQIRVHKRQSYDVNSLLSFGGTVYYLHCNTPRH